MRSSGVSRWRDVLFLPVPPGPQKHLRMPPQQRNRPTTHSSTSSLSPITPILPTPHEGSIAPLPQDIIKGEQGNTVWDPQQYAFIKEGDGAPDSVNPSLWRQSQLIDIQRSV